MTDYPILVANWTGAQALTIVCERCHAERVIDDAGEINNEDLYECPANGERSIGSEQWCKGIAGMKYVEGERCRGCGALGFEQPVDGCCSRRCQLQADYAAMLERTR